MAISLSIPCEGTMLPTKAALTNLFVQIANLPSVLTVEIERIRREIAVEVDEEIRRRLLEKIAPLEAAIEQVKSIISKVEKLLGNFPISLSKPIFKGLSIPDIEWERRITALCQEFHLYVQAKLMEIINNVLPISFVVPVLGLSIDIVALFADPSYRAALKAQIAEQIDSLFGLLPDIYKFYDGVKYGVNSIAIRAEILFSYIMAKLQNGALSIIYEAIGGLINKFKTIWDTLGLPSLPALLSIDIGAIIQGAISSLIEQLKNAPDRIKNEIRKQIIKVIEGISLFGFNLASLIGGEIKDFVISLEEKIHRYIEVLQNFAEQWPMYLIKKFMAKINKFFKLIGLGALFQWFTLDFCKFLKIVGLPTSISFDVDVSISSGVTTTTTLENNYTDPYPGVTGELPDPA
jgi:hypothetical protein